MIITTRKKHLILFSSLIWSFVVLISAAIAAPVIYDDFNDNRLDAFKWASFQIGYGPTVSETNQRLEIDLPGNSIEDPSAQLFQAKYYSACQLKGNFDIQVDFSLPVWPYANGVRTALSCAAGALERTSFGTPEDFPGYPRDNYIFTTHGPSSNVISSSDLSGRLRIVREGDVFTGYYFNGYTWISAGSGTSTTADVGFELVAWSHDYAFTDQNVKVAFDNVIINKGVLVCPVEKDLIVNVGSGRCLTVQHASPIENSPIIISDCNSSDNQLFAFSDDNAVTVNGEICLDTLYGTLVNKTCAGSTSQAWTLESNGRLINRYTKKCAKVAKNLQKNGSWLIASSTCSGSQSELFVRVPKGTQVEQCFGAVGVKCDGVPPKARAGKRLANGTQNLAVSVGSIAHDNCCLNHPDGFFCSGFEFVLSDWSRPCMAEWAKAFSDTADGRQWRAVFGPPYSVANYTDNLTPAPGPNRELGRITKDGGWEVVLLEEKIATRSLAAPKGTKIDITDQDFCQSGELEYSKKRKSYVCK